jgi:hypothetical protein
VFFLVLQVAAPKRSLTAVDGRQEILKTFSVAAAELRFHQAQATHCRSPCGQGLINAKIWPRLEERNLPTDQPWRSWSDPGLWPELYGHGHDNSDNPDGNPCPRAAMSRKHEVNKELTMVLPKDGCREDRIFEFYYSYKLCSHFLFCPT